MDHNVANTLAAVDRETERRNSEFEVSEEEAHCRHPAAGTRLQRKTHHVELRPSVYHKVMCITVTVKALTKVHAV